MLKHKRLVKGVTLIELLLVIVISASILMMFLGYVYQTGQATRRDKAVMLEQQILNAALTFYAQNGRWPSTTGSTTNNAWIPIQSGHELMDQLYIAAVLGAAPISPYGGNFYTSWDTGTNTFYVTFGMLDSAASNPTGVLADATIMAGQLPFGRAISKTTGVAAGNPGFTSGSPCTIASTYCFVVTGVPPPGQNLNNARSANFASVYHSSSCVPAPSCPANMVPQIFVVPTSVSGINDAPTNCTNNTTTNCTANVYPISSYTAYAVGNVTAATGTLYNYVGGPYYLATAASSMPSCTSGATAPCYAANASSGSGTTPITAPGYYWRVCLGIVTERGTVTPTQLSASQPSPWGLMTGTVMVITRCAPGNTTTGQITEPVGSDFTVFNPSGN